MENELQALVTGIVIGALIKAQKDFVMIHVEPEFDDEGNYLPAIAVQGKATGTQLLVKVEVVEE